LTTIIYSKYTVPKYGNRPDENDDAVEVYQSQDTYLKNQKIRCAIADGATQTSFSSLWARLLVKEAIKYMPSKKRFEDITLAAQKYWKGEIDKIELPWHAEEKVKLGAFSTLLWISIKRPESPLNPIGTWKAIVIGDSNLFIIRDDKIYLAFPLEKSQEFGNSPVLLCSIPSRNDQISEYIRFAEGNCISGDQFLLATDALAQYILKQSENGEKPWNDLTQLSKESNPQLSYETWIRLLRESGKIHNDDTTLVNINLFEEQNSLFEN
jgi:serine/threonine protein phosphatase PrpC